MVKKRIKKDIFPKTHTQASLTKMINPTSSMDEHIEETEIIDIIKENEQEDKAQSTINNNLKSEPDQSPAPEPKPAEDVKQNNTV